MTVSTAMPLAGRIAWWGTAFLGGRVSPDDYLDAARGDAANHVVATPGSTAPGRSLLEATAALRNAGASGLGAAFPVPGDPRGLAGPRELTEAATDAGEAVLALGLPVEPGTAWVPHRVGGAVEWTPYPARRRSAPDVGDADRALRATLLETAETLSRLDVARWRPEVADALLDLRSGTPLTAPPGVPPRCVDLAGRALHLLAVVDLAQEDDGGAVSLGEAAQRRDALVPLGAAARQALTAACSPDGWPTVPGGPGTDADSLGPR